MRLPRCCFRWFFVFAFLIFTLPARAQNSVSEVSARLSTDISALTKFPSRVPGTPGNAAAADYVASRFRAIGLKNVRTEDFTVTVPVTKFARLSLGGQDLKVYPVYPNEVVPSTTPADGITGTLVYAGNGTAADFNGHDVTDSIVALNFNSGENWMTAADLGARAIIFLGQGTSDRGEAERKYARLPLEMPRFFVPEADVAKVKAAAGQTVTVTASVVWQEVTASNVFGEIAGSAPPTGDSGSPAPDTLILSGYYDSMSAVPDLAPGAEAAGDCAALIETARRLVQNPPAYNVLVLADGAHHEALAGMREFAAEHLVDKTGKGGDAVKAKIASYRAFVGLDLTSRSPTIGLFAKGAFYDQMGGSESLLLNQFSGLAKAESAYAVTQARARGLHDEDIFVDGITGKEGRTWKSYLPAPVAFDSEVATEAALPGFTFATANDSRLLQDTPYDVPANLDLNTLAQGTNNTYGLLTNGLDQILQGDSAKPTANIIPYSSTLSKNFGFLVGRAIYRDVFHGTSFLPDTPLPDEQHGDVGDTALGALVTARGQDPLEQKSYCGVRGVMISRASYSKAKAGTNAVSQFLFDGPRVGDSKGGGNPTYEFEAFSLNADGHVIFAPDQGSERQRFTPTFSSISSTLTWKDQDTGQYNPDVSLICFGCRALSIYDTLDQRYFSVLKQLAVLDAKTDAEPVQYGYLKPVAPPLDSEQEPAAIVFARPQDRIKVTMAQGLLGNRLVLLNTAIPDPDGHDVYPEGGGFEVPDTEKANRIPFIAYQAGLDLWTLDQQRIRLLKGFGISNERVDSLHAVAGCTDAKNCPTEGYSKPTGGSLFAAAKALKAFQYDVFYQEARRAFGLESRAYPDVENTSQDVLKGIIFYLALLLPFSFFMERMLFGFPDIRKQIAGTSIVFLIVFGCISQVHPAFQLAATPFIILLAFIILALTVVVTAFLQSKFEQEIKRLKQGVHYADMGRLSALGAAFGLGIANMRRRPTRTALTCVTLILLTFTVLSFTSVTANIANFARPFGDTDHVPPYQGFLIRQDDWSPMAEAVITSLANDVESQGLGKPALRAWYLPKVPTDSLNLRVSNAANPNKFYYAPALVGMTPAEVTIGSPIPGTVIQGRWLQPGDTDVCLLPRDLLLSDAQRAAENPDADATPTPVPTATATPAGEASTDIDEDTGPPLGLTPDNAVGASVQIGGKNFKVIGIFDDSKWFNRHSINSLHDLDDEEFSPVDYASQATNQAGSSNNAQGQSPNQGQVQRYVHLPANALVVLPYQTAINMGATPRSLAVGVSDTKVVEKQLNDLMERAAVGIFGATPDPATGKLVSKLYSSVEATSYDGFAALAIPVLIAALIIANTMLGSVYERTREIGIYSAIGLAPVHVAALFIAEAAVYAVLGSISGYLIAQVVAKVMTVTGWLSGITLNYSSSSAVLATLIVMATVLLSTLYPAYMASRLTQQDDRKAELGEPVGDLWRLQFPFTVSGVQTLGMAMFLEDYFETHTDTSVGKFYTDRPYFTSLPLRDAVEILNDGVVPLAEGVAVESNGKKSRKAAKETEGEILPGDAPPPKAAPKGGIIRLENVLGEPDLTVYRLSMRTWLAPFDMGVSQDTDIILLPASEPGLYELQLRLERRSGEIAAWKRVNREFMTDLRKQLLLWRVIKPEGQHEYILRGRAHIAGQAVPDEAPGTTIVN